MAARRSSLAVFLLATLADVLTPLYAGRLVEAVRRAAPRPAPAWRGTRPSPPLAALVGTRPSPRRSCAISAFMRHHHADAADDDATSADGFFHRVQRFSTDWHANSFAGSTVRKITRGMWALDLLNDTLLVALLPSLVMLVGATHPARLLTGRSMGARRGRRLAALYRLSRWRCRSAMSRRRQASPMPGTPSSAARWPMRSPATRWSRPSAPRAARTAASPRCSPNGASARRAPGRAAPSTARRRASCCSPCGPAVIGFALVSVASGQANAGDITFVLTTVLRPAGLSARCRQAHPQPAALGQRHGGTGRHARAAARHRGSAGRASRSRIGDGRDRLRRRHLPLWRPSRPPLYDDFSVADPAGRTGRPRRAFRLGQDDLRQADPAPLRRQRRARSRSTGRTSPTSTQAVAARPDRHRAAGADPVPPLAGGEHRLWPAGRHAGGDRAGGEARQRA